VPSFVGSLIFPSVAVIRRLDTKATRDAGGYDDDFDEFTMVDSDADGVGEPQRKESAELKIPAQVATWLMEKLYQAPHGQVPESEKIELTMHFRDLHRLGLVHTDGKAKLELGDRLVRIEDKAGNNLFEFTEPPGAYLAAVRPSGFLGARRNLLVCTFADRRKHTQRKIDQPQS
jgi:hypothetical protein